jgi:hypothetical protein
MAIPTLPERPAQLDEPLPTEEDKPGTNETQHHPDPRAEPIPGREKTWHPRSPYTTGNYWPMALHDGVRAGPGRT